MTYRIEKGDLIAIERKIKIIKKSYWHWGVYIGDGMLMHLSSHGYSLTSKYKADVHRISFKKFAKDSTTFKCKQCPDHLNRDDVVKKAIHAENKLSRKKRYNLFKNNCEHFATWCHGEARSEQVENAIIQLKDLACVGQNLVGTIVEMHISILLLSVFFKWITEYALTIFALFIGICLTKFLDVSNAAFIAAILRQFLIILTR